MSTLRGCRRCAKPQAAPPPGDAITAARFSALIAGKRQAPAPQCSPYVRLCYKNEPFVSSGRIGATVQPGAAMTVQGDEPGRSRSGFLFGGGRS